MAKAISDSQWSAYQKALNKIGKRVGRKRKSAGRVSTSAPGDPNL